MYWDIIVFAILVVIVFVFFRKASSIVYFIASFDILLRLLTFVKDHIGLKDVASLIDKYIPESIPAMITHYTNGVVAEVLLWVYAGVFTVFLVYTVKTFFRKRHR